MASSVNRMLAPGSVIAAVEGATGARVIALSATDSDGYARVAPILPAKTPGCALGMALEPSDFTVGGLAGWLRLDRIGWRDLDGAEPLGTLKAATLARIHRALCTD